MTFEEILDQALDMLRRRGRVTYGALKRQFNLDDAYLEDLKNEIVEGQQQAVDEGGKVLVWTGGPAAAARDPMPEAHGAFRVRFWTDFFIATAAKIKSDALIFYLANPINY